MCTLPLVPKTEVAAINTGFGAIHSAILGLCARCLGHQSWVEKIKPSTDSEVVDSGTAASGFTEESVFDKRVREKHALLNMGLVAYLGAASEFTEDELNALLSPLTITPKEKRDGNGNEKGAHFLGMPLAQLPGGVMLIFSIASIPSIGDAIEALNNLSHLLAHTLKQMSDISAELSLKQNIGVDNLLQVVKSVDGEFLRHLDIRQKRALICRELEAFASEVKKDGKVVLSEDFIVYAAGSR
jgi:nuclear pore complex protein Nup205